MPQMRTPILRDPGDEPRKDAHTGLKKCPVCNEFYFPGASTPANQCGGHGTEGATGMPSEQEK